MKFRKITAAVSTVIITASVCVSGVSTNAENVDWKAAYKKALISETKYVQIGDAWNQGYSLYDFDEDGQPEMVISLGSGRGGGTWLFYTYRDGKAEKYFEDYGSDAWINESEKLFIDYIGSGSVSGVYGINKINGLDFELIKTASTYDVSSLTNLSSGYALNDYSPFEETEEENKITESLGDLNDDKTVNAKDGAAVLVAAAQIGAGQGSGLTEEQIKFADINKDNAVNAKDAALILQFAAYKGSGGTLIFYIWCNY